MPAAQPMGEIFSGLLPFLEVAERRSFRQAAAALGVSTAAVSKAVAKLEESLGSRLLERSPQHVELTPEGRVFLERCRAAVLQLKAARALVGASRDRAEGTLRISHSPILGPVVARSLAALALEHPRLRFELVVTDRLVRLAEEEIDVAVRIGELPASGLRARRLGVPRWVTVAAPSYLARAGTPQSVADLDRHRCLRFLTPRGKPRPWVYPHAPAPEPESELLTDNGGVLLEAALAGAGVTQLVDFMVREHLREGRLVEVLAEHTSEGPPIHAVWSAGRQRALRVRLLLEQLVRAFQGAGSAGS